MVDETGLVSSGITSVEPMQQAKAITQRTKYLDKKIQPTLAKLASLGITGRRLEHLVNLFNTKGNGAHNAVIFPLMNLLRNSGSNAINYAGSSADAYDQLIEYAESITNVRQSFHEYGYSISYATAAELYNTMGEKSVDFLDALIEQCNLDINRDDPSYSQDNTKFVHARMRELLDDARSTGHPAERLLKRKMDLVPDTDKLDNFNFDKYWRENYGPTRSSW